MTRAQRWLEEYSQSHQHRTNKLIHWFAVPLIYWTVLALAWSLPVPAAFPGWINWALITLVLVQLYYFYLSPRLGLAMVGFNALNWLLLIAADRVLMVPLWQPALAIFVLAWIAQFIGHEVEGKKPSFFTDVFFLLIGPAWCVNFVMHRVGLRT